jgi:rhodanese-related sulfurtransferase
MLDADPSLLILDARSDLARSDDPRTLPRSIVARAGSMAEACPRTQGRTIVTFCTCPNEASAALLAEELINAGYRRVRVLTGGVDAVALLSAHGREAVNSRSRSDQLFMTNRIPLSSRRLAVALSTAGLAPRRRPGHLLRLGELRRQRPHRERLIAGVFR